MKIIVDCGNGVPGAFAPEFYRSMGCTVEELFCEVDGNFPNHHPDPSQPENLKDLIAGLASGDDEIGLAFDGDGDRLGVVTKDGKIIFPDRQLMLFAADVLRAQSGREGHFRREIDAQPVRLGSRPRRRAGPVENRPFVIKAKMKETGALLAGEMSGHMFFKERWYGFDDGIYAGARLLEYLSGGRHRRRVRQAAGYGEHARTADQNGGGRTLHADRPPAEDRPFPWGTRDDHARWLARRVSPTALALRVPPTRRRWWCCVSRPMTQLRSKASRTSSAAFSAPHCPVRCCRSSPHYAQRSDPGAVPRASTDPRSQAESGGLRAAVPLRTLQWRYV